MTNTTAALDADPSTPATATRSTSARVTCIASLVGGAAFVVDTVTITAINSSFGRLDNAVFFVGLGGLAVTAVAMAVYVSGRAKGARRAGLGVLTFVALLVVLGVVGQLMDAIGRHVFSDANVGLHSEWSFFTIGLCLLGIAAWTRHRTSRVRTR
jgi:hypothetical protein